MKTVSSAISCKTICLQASGCKGSFIHLKFQVLVLHTFYVAAHSRLCHNSFAQVEPIQCCCLPCIIQPNLQVDTQVGREWHRDS